MIMENKEVEILSNVESFVNGLFSLIDSLDEDVEFELLLKYNLLKQINRIIKFSGKKEVKNEC